MAFSILGMHRNLMCDVYLGLPSFTGRNKQRLFDGIKQRIWKKLQGWKSKMFSIGGREILIKAVAQGIPTYKMSLFLLPSTLCKRVRSMITNFWWGATGEEMKIHWRKWKFMCYPKSQGGMGFRDFFSINQALLAKQACHILSKPDSLAAQIYKAKYFLMSIFLQAPMGNNPSYVWRSILWGRKLLLQGLRWQITTGLNISVFKDPCLLRRKLFRPITIPHHNHSQLKVADLLTISGEWNWPLITSVLWEVDCAEIRRIPMGSGSGCDKLI